MFDIINYKMASLNSSLDSIELELYHRPNEKWSSIVAYLKAQNLQFYTDAKQKQTNYYARTEVIDTEDFGIRRNRFLKRKTTPPTDLSLE